MLAGGTARRLGGVDKPSLVVGGRTLLDRVLDALPATALVVAVGPVRATRRPVRWAREEPPGGGPLAGVAAGLGALADAASAGAADGPGDGPGVASGDGTRHGVPGGAPGRAPAVPERLLLLAGDLPFLTAAAVQALLAGLADDDADAALAVDHAGRDQPLCAAWRTSALRAALPADPAGAPLRVLLAGARVTRLTLPTAPTVPPPWWDCDTPGDLEQARSWTAEEPR